MASQEGLVDSAQMDATLRRKQFPEGRETAADSPVAKVAFFSYWGTLAPIPVSGRSDRTYRDSPRQFDIEETRDHILPTFAARATLNAMRANGYTLVAIANSGPGTREEMEKAGVVGTYPIRREGIVDAVVISSEVGRLLPSRYIFEVAGQAAMASLRLQGVPEADADKFTLAGKLFVGYGGSLVRRDHPDWPTWNTPRRQVDLGGSKAGELEGAFAMGMHPIQVSPILAPQRGGRTHTYGQPLSSDGKDGNSLKVVARNVRAVAITRGMVTAYEVAQAGLDIGPQQGAVLSQKPAQVLYF